jgi:hypothetical protein
MRRRDDRPSVPETATNRERALWHADEAEQALIEAIDVNVADRRTARATIANTHATLALFYRDLPDTKEQA